MASPNKRSRKRARQAEGLAEAQERFRYGLLAIEVLRTLDLLDLQLQVADVEVIPRLDGAPDSMHGWLIFTDQQQARTAASPHTAAKITNRLRQALLAGGFPKEAISSFNLHFTSLPEIEKAGGSFAFFR